MPVIHMKATRSAIAALITIAATAGVAAGAPQASTSTAATQRPAQVRIRCVNCSDSARIRGGELVQRLDSLRTALMRSRLSTEETAAVEREMATTVRALQEMLEASMNGEMRRRAEAGVVYQMAQPQGYLGVLFDGPMYDDIINGQRLLRFLDYPRIASVDPSSPAERAGVVAGDTVLAFNGTDVLERTFNLTRMLVPDEKFTMKVRRKGDAKEFRIVVGEAPSYAIARVMPMPPARATEAPDAPEARALPLPQGRTRVRSPGEAPTAVAAGGYAPGFGPRITIFGGNVVAGARLEVLDANSEGLAKAFGAKEGLLVLSVTPGTPASERIGLLDGDVILSADGTAMLTVRDFQRVVAGQDRSGETVKLVILRDKKQRELTLKP